MQQTGLSTSLAGNRFRASLIAVVVQQELGAGAGQSQGDCAPNAAGRSGHQRGLTLQHGHSEAVKRQYKAGQALGMGRMTVNTAPPPGADAASMFPRCSLRTALQMLNPRPVPRPGRLVV